MLLAERLMVLMKNHFYFNLFDSFTSSGVSRDRFKGATKLKQKSANLRQVNLTNEMMKNVSNLLLRQIFSASLADNRYEMQSET